MSASHFARSPEACEVVRSPTVRTSAAVPMLAALVYPNEIYPHAAFQRAVEHCRARALKLAGVLQHSACDDPAHPCDVVLEDLATGSHVELFERRGKGARGCRLDLAALAAVSVGVEHSLNDQPDVLILNKFGKAEAEGGGLGDCIARAMEKGIPTLIGVPTRNLDAWRRFAGEMAAEFNDDLDRIRDWLQSVRQEADRPASAAASCAQRPSAGSLPVVSSSTDAR